MQLYNTLQLFEYTNSKLPQLSGFQADILNDLPELLIAMVWLLVRISPEKTSSSSSSSINQPPLPQKSPKAPFFCYLGRWVKPLACPFPCSTAGNNDPIATRSWPKRDGREKTRDPSFGSTMFLWQEVDGFFWPVALCFFYYKNIKL